MVRKTPDQGRESTNASEALPILVVPLGTEPENIAVLCPLLEQVDLLDRLRDGGLNLRTFDGVPEDIVDRVRAKLLGKIERTAWVARGRRMAAGVSAGILAVLSVGTWLIPDSAGATDEWLFPLGALIGLGAWRLLGPRVRGYRQYQKELPAKLDELDPQPSSLLTALQQAIRAWDEGDMEHAVVDPGEWKKEGQSRHLEQVVAALEDHFRLQRLPRDREPLRTGRISSRLERRRCAILNRTGASTAALEVYRLLVASYKA